jgi:hypothetical protein
MGLRDLGKRLSASVEDLDSMRLQDRFEGLGLTTIAEAPIRRPIRIGGEITRVLIAPRNGTPALEIRVSDGTGHATAVFTGRRMIAGLAHGRAIVLEGVAYDERGRWIILNPAYTLLPV